MLNGILLCLKRNWSSLTAIPRVVKEANFFSFSLIYQTYEENLMIAALVLLFWFFSPISPPFLELLYGCNLMNFSIYLSWQLAGKSQSGKPWFISAVVDKHHINMGLACHSGEQAACSGSKDLSLHEEMSCRGEKAGCQPGGCSQPALSCAAPEQAPALSTSHAAVEMS